MENKDNASAQPTVTKDEVLNALTQLKEGSAVQVVQHLETQHNDVPEKLIIARTHELLTELHAENVIAANEQNGTLVYATK